MLGTPCSEQDRYLLARGGVWQKINPLPKEMGKWDCVIKGYKQISWKEIPPSPDREERLTCGSEECWDLKLKWNWLEIQKRRARHVQRVCSGRKLDVHKVLREWDKTGQARRMQIDHTICTMLFSPLGNVLGSFPMGTYKSIVSIFTAAFYSTVPKPHYATSSVLTHIGVSSISLLK